MRRKNTQSVRYFGVGRFFAATLLASLPFCACQPPQTSFKLYGTAQGTYYNIQYYDDQGRDLQPTIDSFLTDFDLTASLWVDSSLLRRINANLTDSTNPIFADMLHKSQSIQEYTNGAFDCRVGRLVQMWGFSFSQRHEPDSTTLCELLRYAKGDVSIINGKIVKQYPETELDFNAIAQGYSVDLLGSLFDSLGIADYMIDIGGEVIARGKKANGHPWRIGIERPAADSISSPEIQAAISLHNAAVVTSGSYRKYYEKDGHRYSHTIDPSTGHPVEHTLLSASVVEKECWLADAMATAYMVMGLEKALTFIAAHPDGPGTKYVMFIYDDNGTLKTLATPDFETLVINK